MRHTRNRQLYKISGKHSWRMITCQEMKLWNSMEDKLDESFKWHREYNNVSFDTTHYYPKKITTPLYVDLYKEDSVYY